MKEQLLKAAKMHAQGEYERAKTNVMVYLNDSGGTEFFGNKIPAETGKVVCFPPNWMFPHNGYVGDKPKYFMGSYLHFELPSVKEAREKQSASSSAG